MNVSCRECKKKFKSSFSRTPKKYFQEIHVFDSVEKIYLKKNENLILEYLGEYIMLKKLLC